MKIKVKIKYKVKMKWHETPKTEIVVQFQRISVSVNQASLKPAC
jgi:hypothetical protein